MAKINLPSLEQTLAAGKTPSPLAGAKIQVLHENASDVVAWANLLTNEQVAGFKRAISSHQAEQKKAARAKAAPKAEPVTVPTV